MNSKCQRMTNSCASTDLLVVAPTEVEVFFADVTGRDKLLGADFQKLIRCLISHKMLGPSLNKKSYCDDKLMRVDWAVSFDTGKGRSFSFPRHFSKPAPGADLPKLIRCLTRSDIFVKCLWWSNRILTYFTWKLVTINPNISSEHSFFLVGYILLLEWWRTRILTYFSEPQWRWTLNLPSESS